MVLFTSYLGYLNSREFKERWADRDLEVIYIMIHRGNPEVEPDLATLDLYKRGLISWSRYEAAYLMKLEEREAIRWMRDIAREAHSRDVVLVCFEKHPPCHRFVLARAISERFGVPYLGELSDQDLA